MADSHYTEIDVHPSTDPTNAAKYKKIKLRDLGDDTYAMSVWDENPSSGGGGGGGTILPASNVYGEIAGLAGSATGVLASVPSAAAAYRVRGFTVTANGDCRVYIEIAGSEVLSGRISTNQRTIHIPLPNGIDTATGATIELKVTNLRPSAIDVEGTLLGEA